MDGEAEERRGEKQRAYHPTKYTSEQEYTLSQLSSQLSTNLAITTPTTPPSKPTDHIPSSTSPRAFTTTNYPSWYAFLEWMGEEEREKGFEFVRADEEEEDEEDEEDEEGGKGGEEGEAGEARLERRMFVCSFGREVDEEEEGCGAEVDENWDDRGAGALDSRPELAERPKVCPCIVIVETQPGGSEVRASCSLEHNHPLAGSVSKKSGNKKKKRNKKNKKRKKKGKGKGDAGGKNGEDGDGDSDDDDGERIVYCLYELERERERARVEASTYPIGPLMDVACDNERDCAKLVRVYGLLNDLVQQNLTALLISTRHSLQTNSNPGANPAITITPGTNHARIDAHLQCRILHTVVHEYVFGVMKSIKREGVGYLTPEAERKVEEDVKGLMRTLRRAVSVAVGRDVCLGRVKDGGGGDGEDDSFDETLYEGETEIELELHAE